MLLSRTIEWSMDEEGGRGWFIKAMDAMDLLRRDENDTNVDVVEEQSRGCFGGNVIGESGEGGRVERAERKSARERRGGEMESDGERKSATKGFLFPSG